MTLFESWREILEIKDFSLSRVKTEYIEFKFSSNRCSKTIVKIRVDELDVYK